MRAPVLPDPLEVVLSTDWIEEPFDFFVGDLNTPDNFTNCSVTGGLYRAGSLVVDLGSASTGRIVVTASPARVSIRCPLAPLLAVGPGAFTMDLGLQTPTAGLQPLVGAAVRLLAP